MQVELAGGNPYRGAGGRFTTLEEATAAPGGERRSQELLRQFGGRQVAKDQVVRVREAMPDVKTNPIARFAHDAQQARDAMIARLEGELRSRQGMQDYLKALEARKAAYKKPRQQRLLRRHGVDWCAACRQMAPLCTCEERSLR